ncbi:MAG: hypothetical protein HXM47_03585 [Pseudoleptotrichia goodfellowii]|nr:hypothetical protein [Pseudoleptotrichia goodfellowii]
MGIDINTIKTVTELGIMAVISGVFIKQQQKLFKNQEIQQTKLMEQQEKVITVLAKLENQLNNDRLRGKGLEIALILKIQDLRWVIQKRIIKYIKNNHIKENWVIINKEIDTFFNIKLIDFETDMHDIIDDTTFKIIYDILKKEFAETKKILLDILSDLKEDGTKEKELYEKAVRIVEAHMQTIENELIAQIKELIN